MRKAFRELARMAEHEGVERAHIVVDSPHDRLCGLVAGQPFRIVISATKAFANERYQKCTRLNIRREVRRLHELQRGGEDSP